MKGGSRMVIYIITGILILIFGYSYMGMSGAKPAESCNSEVIECVKDISAETCESCDWCTKTKFYGWICTFGGKRTKIDLEACACGMHRR
jgi:hypothetical protein